MCLLEKKKVNASVPIIPIVCAKFSTSRNTISETIGVSTYIDTKKDASLIAVRRDLPLLLFLKTARHHFLPQSGWVSYWIKGEQDIPSVIELFKMRYDSLKPNTKLVTRTI